MKISIIAAIGLHKREIGFEGRLPWHLSWDLKNFKKLTMGHHILMGRKTYESIGRPLPGRTSVVLSQRNVTREAVTASASHLSREALDKGSPNLIWASHLDKAIDDARAKGESELFVIGGAQIYQHMTARADRMYLTTVDYSGPSDTYFPNFSMSEWTSLHREEHASSAEQSLSFSFEILERKF
ncbi:MAG: dihydrofolate reductase [Oligoflexales bacterium]|nr:dihydrofolate reductase [Oligoflexales bacterium]